MELWVKHFKRGKNLNKFKAQVSNPKEILSRKGANPRGTLMGSPKEHVSIATRWNTILRIAPSLNWATGVPR
jgi:hypothetical protein